MNNRSTNFRYLKTVSVEFSDYIWLEGTDATHLDTIKEQHGDKGVKGAVRDLIESKLRSEMRDCDFDNYNGLSLYITSIERECFHNDPAQPFYRVEFAGNFTVHTSGQVFSKITGVDTFTKLEELRSPLC